MPDLLVNGGFNTNTNDWTRQSGFPNFASFVVRTATPAPKEGAGYANVSLTDPFEFGQTLSKRFYQDVAVPGDATEVELSFWYRKNLGDAGSSVKVQVRDAGDDSLVELLGTISGVGDTRSTGDWAQLSYDLSGYAGETVRVAFELTVAGMTTTFLYLDDVRLTYEEAPVVVPPGAPEVLGGAAARPGVREFARRQRVSLTVPEGCTVFFTRDGSDPTTSAHRSTYAAPFYVNSRRRIRAAACNDAGFGDEVNLLLDKERRPPRR